MPEATASWWTLLRGVSLLNLLAWALVALLLHRRVSGSPAAARVHRWQLLLSAGYVLGCAYRSMFPVFDVPRIVLVDSWWSSVIVGRSVATVAELCFAAQWALLLGEFARRGSTFARRAAMAVVPMIIVAEVCSWASVLTTSNLGHVVEETLWGLAALLVVAGLVVLRPRLAADERRLVIPAIAAGAAYAAYMFAVDVPMYWARWAAELAAGHVPLSLAQGIADASTRWIVSHRWDVWKGEAVWMTLYFSVAVWFSIALAHRPHGVVAAPAR